MEEKSLSFEVGQKLKSGGYTKTEPRTWTDSEITAMVEVKEKGMTIQEIAELLDRSQVSVQIKLKRLSKKADTYNHANREMKYEANREFFNLIQPKSIADVYAGESFWETLNPGTMTNDIDTKFKTYANYDAFDFLLWAYTQNLKFDMIDLDPYGSAYECLDMAVRMSRKGLIVSFGEVGHKRWKRTAFVEPRYGITDWADGDHEEKFIAEVQRIARCHKKLATPVKVLNYQNFCRVYFTLEKTKTVEQWEMKEAGY